MTLLPAALTAHAITHVYIIKFGEPDEPSVHRFARTDGHPMRTLVHAVFDGRAPHGHVYARISPCVPAPPSVPVVPHIVRRREPLGPDLREELGIPTDATVFGRHGGYNVFDVLEARAAVLSVARQRADIYFVFMNTQPLWLREGDEPPSNILYLPPTLDEARKCAFIRTCDAMLHARMSGETFGLAIAEFSAHNRPVLTSSVHHDHHMARFHLDALGSKGLYYHDESSCAALLLSFDREAARRQDWNAYRAFEPERVMASFRRVFLKDVAPTGEGGAATGKGAVAKDKDVAAAEVSLLDGQASRHAQKPLGPEQFPQEEPSRRQALGSAGTDKHEAEARRRYERLLAGGARMPCYGK